MSKMHQGVGARVPRKEDTRHLHGRGNFVADIMLTGQLEVAFLRSPVAHARIRGIRKPVGSETAVFLRGDMPEVLAVVTPAAVPTYKLSEQHPLAHGKVRFVGEPIAMCVAKTRGEAEDLAERVELDLEELPAVVDAHVARMNNSVRVHDEWSDNVFLTTSFESSYFHDAVKQAGVVVKRELELSRQAQVPLEGKAVLADWDYRIGQLVVHSATQMPHIVRIGLARFLGLEERLVRVISPDVGGGFGYKGTLWPEELCVAWLAIKYRRPFRYIEDRREHLVSGANARQHHYSLTAYANNEGRLLALDAVITVDGGAYSNWPFYIGLEPTQAAGNLPGPYDFRGYRVKTYGVATNKPGLLPYRGVSRTGVCFAMELMMDAIARAVGREAWEVRLENLVRPAQMPYDNVTGKHYDSGDYPRALRLAKEKIKYVEWRERQRRGELDGRLIGIGFASYCEQSSHGPSVFVSWGLPLVPGYDQANVRVTPDGALEVRAGVHSHGQGMETVFAQIAHEVLGVDIEKIHVLLGDTASTPYSTGTYASRSTVMAGGAIVNTCKKLLPSLLKIGAHLLKCGETEVRFESGCVVGSRGSVGLREIAEAWYLRPYLLPQDADLTGLEASMSYRPKVDTGVFSYASHAAVVAVDCATGHVEILDYVIVEDCGTKVNPMLVEGQTLGGTAQGIGTAMYEEMQYDANGQPSASTLADYLLPGPTEIPAIRIYSLETPSPYTEFGVKGMGEGGAIAPPAAIFNGVNDALRDLGVEMGKTPLTPIALLEAIERSKSGGGRLGEA